MSDVQSRSAGDGVSAPLTLPETFWELVGRIAEIRPQRLAETLARQAVVMGTHAEWPPEMIEYVGIETAHLLDELGLPPFFSKPTEDDDRSLRFWCALDTVRTLDDWAEQYGWELPECEHRWELYETGYARMWDAELAPNGDVHARERGMSDHGDGPLKLECLRCGEQRDVEGKVTYQ